nr:MAG TPA: hypothetical protein [Caudoviricetes sp.]
MLGNVAWTCPRWRGGLFHCHRVGSGRVGSGRPLLLPSMFFTGIEILVSYYL